MRIAITGIGIISSLGIGNKANRENLLAALPHIDKTKLVDTIHKDEWLVGEVELSNDQLKERLCLPVHEHFSRTSLLGMVAAKEAVEDANLSPDQIKNLSFVNGTTVGGMDLTERYFKHWTEGDFSNIDVIKQHAAGATSVQIADFLGGLSDVKTISTACSSALNAMIVGANELCGGKTERVIVGGAESSSKFHLNGFAALGILSKSICRPFQEDRDGINLGEGAGYLILETEQAAHERGAKIYGYLAGWGNRCDAYHATASSPDGEGAYNAMNEALNVASISPDKVEYINAHGTGTPNNDASEATAIARLFGDKIFYESTKNLTSHTTSASGAIETIFCLYKMEAMGYNCVMNNAFGFGGNDTSIVLTSNPNDINITLKESKIEAYAVEIESDVDYKQYLPVMQARRLTPQMRRMVVAAKQAIQKAGIESVDAVIVGTKWGGGMGPSLSLLSHYAQYGEVDLSPAQFMLSVHNSVAGLLAILLGAKGYNSTFTDLENPYQEAYDDAIQQISAGKAKNVLVCEFDEVTSPWSDYLNKVGMDCDSRAKAIVIKC